MAVVFSPIQKIGVISFLMQKMRAASRPTPKLSLFFCPITEIRAASRPTIKKEGNFVSDPKNVGNFIFYPKNDISCFRDLFHGLLCMFSAELRQENEKPTDDLSNIQLGSRSWYTLTDYCGF